MPSGKILQNKEEDLLLHLKKNKAQKNQISFLRLFCFIIAVVFLYIHLSSKNYGWLALAILSFLLFVGLVFVSAKFQEKINFIQAQLKVIEYITTAYISPGFDFSAENQHPFSRDLDVLGDISLFSKINKTQSFLGAVRLKEMLLNPLLSSQEIKRRQESIQELSQNMEQNVEILALIHQLNLKKPVQLFENSLEIEPKTSPFVRFSIYFLPIVYLFLLGFSLYRGFYVLGVFTLVGMVAVSYFMAHRFDDRISRAFQLAETNTKQFSGFEKIFQRWENQNLNSEDLILLQKSFSHPKASFCLKNLGRQVKNLENGQTSYFGFVLNLFFFWNLRYTLKVEKILARFQSKIPVWIDAFSQWEALISLAIYRINHPDYILPDASEKYEGLSVENLSHPLLNAEESVPNSFSIRNRQNIAIITGANMSGKSTFLRTLGCNLVLAMNGLPVSAQRFDFSPMKIFTSMRTSDSLAKGASYFHAEIYRLSEIKSLLEQKIPLFIILDEILKGTNSVDKLTGSRLFLEKITTLSTPFSCIIATHDLELTDLEKENPTHFTNYYFDLKTENHQLLPDYKIKPGKTSTMNALFLMKKIGIID